MTTNVTYRDASVVVPTSTTVKGAPLSNSEIDGNFKSMVNSVDAKVDSTDLAAPGGAALVGADTGLTYAAGTVGAMLKSQQSSITALSGQIAGILDGATFTGPIVLSADAAEPLQPVTLQQLNAAMVEIPGAAIDRFFTSGEALPISNIGPIWHDDYNSLMTWQSFTANGASYTGYASQFIGRIEMDTQPTARTGYKRVGSETLALSRSQFAALRAWGLHNGRFVAVGVWQAGTLLMADNADGVTFRAFDVRGEFPRFWDDGRGIDAGRVFGSEQGDAIRNITGWFTSVDGVQTNGAFYKGSNINTSASAPGGDVSPLVGFNASLTVPTADENRPRNTAFSAMLKF